MTYETITVEHQEGVTTLTLKNGPTNAVTPQLLNELERALVDIEYDSSTRCLTITGSGKFFCVGGDLSASIVDPKDVQKSLKENLGLLNNTFIHLSRLPIPVVTAINGDTAGVGMSLALLGDIVIASDSTSLKPAYVSVGLSPDGGMTSSLVRLVGLRMAQKLLYLDEKIPAENAVSIGLITETVPADKLQSHAHALAKKLAHGPTSSIKKIKSLLREAHLKPLEEQVHAEGEMLIEAAISPTGREGMKAFLEKRKPNFINIE